MKLKKSKLLEITRDKILALGYTEFKDTLMGTEGLFIKRLTNGFLLSLGLEMSRLYDSRFTASYYLSKTTRWGATWGDIPAECYSRIGRFLTTEERKLYLDAEYSKEGVIDAWWHANEDGSFENFFRVLEITEPRFLNQENFFSKIENSSEVRELVSYSSEVIALVVDGKIPSQYDYKFIPSTPVDDAPMEWFKAAEMAISKQRGILNPNTVKKLGTDAWRQYKIKQRVTSKSF
jgi:hypothetical protein